MRVNVRQSNKDGQARINRMTQNTQKRSRNARVCELIDVKLGGAVSRAGTHRRDGGISTEHRNE